MAKKYYEEFVDSGETLVDSGAFPLYQLGTNNSNVKLKNRYPIQGSETENIGDAANIQRLKLIVPAATKQVAANGAGDNFTARVNESKRADWVTISTKPVNKMDFLVRTARDQDLDIYPGSPYQKVISTGIKVSLLDIEEKATKEVYTAGTKVAAKLKVDGSDDKAVVKTIQDMVTVAQLKRDDFKTGSNTIVVIVHPVVAKVFSRVQGQSYSLGVNTFPNGLGQSFTYDGIEYFVSKAMNTVAGAGATEVAGAIVMDREAYFNEGMSSNLKEFSQPLLDEQITGHSYGELSAVVDTARIFTVDMLIAGVEGLAKTDIITK